MPTPAPAAAVDAPPPAFARLGRRLARATAGSAGWSPPPLPELIARIDGALAARRAG